METIKKHQLIEIINGLPEEFTINDVVEKIFLLREENEKIKLSPEVRAALEQSEQDIIHGRTISQEEMDKRDLKWLGEQ